MWVRGFSALSLPCHSYCIPYLIVGNPFDYFKLSTPKWAPLQARCHLRSCANDELIMKIKEARSCRSFSKSELLGSGAGWLQCSLENNGILSPWPRILTHSYPPPLSSAALGAEQRAAAPWQLKLEQVPGTPVSRCTWGLWGEELCGAGEE